MIFDCFKKKKPEYSKLGIIVPHTKDAQGAYTHDNKISEYSYGLMLADQLGLPWETRNEGGVKGAAKKLKSKGINISLEPHGNAFNHVSRGCELLVLSDDELSIEYAEILIDSFSLFFPNKKKRHKTGIKLIEKGDRGYNNLVSAKKYMKASILSEFFFIDNPADYIEPEAIVEMIYYFSREISNKQI